MILSLLLTPCMPAPPTPTQAQGTGDGRALESSLVFPSGPSQALHPVGGQSLGTCPASIRAAPIKGSISAHSRYWAGLLCPPAELGRSNVSSGPHLDQVM